MSRKAVWFLLAIAIMLVLAPVSFAQGTWEASEKPRAIDWIDFAAALALGVAAAGCGLQVRVRRRQPGLRATARNPGASGPIRLAFIIGVALIESLVLYVLVIVLIK